MRLLKKIFGPKKKYIKFPYLNWIRLTGKKIRSEAFLHPHCQEEKGELFHGFDEGGTEIETLNLLWAYIRLFKPQYILETGTFHANGTIAMAAALKENGFGKLVSLELDPSRITNAKRRIKRAGLEDYVEIINQSSLEYIDQLNPNKIKFDFTFFDSIPTIRPLEFEKLYQKGALSDLVSFHDTSRLREKTMKDPEVPQDVYVSKLDEIEKKYCKGGIELHLSRGLRIMQLRKDINPAFKI